MGWAFFPFDSEPYTDMAFFLGATTLFFSFLEYAHHYFSFARKKPQFFFLIEFELMWLTRNIVFFL